MNFLIAINMFILLTNKNYVLENASNEHDFAAFKLNKEQVEQVLV